MWLVATVGDSTALNILVLLTATTSSNILLNLLQPYWYSCCSSNILRPVPLTSLSHLLFLLCEMLLLQIIKTWFILSLIKSLLKYHLFMEIIPE